MRIAFLSKTKEDTLKNFRLFINNNMDIVDKVSLNGWATFEDYDTIMCLTEDIRWESSYDYLIVAYDNKSKDDIDFSNIKFTDVVPEGLRVIYCNMEED